jgi:hypothetical protein
MSSAVKNGEKKEEVTPEALLERLKNATSSDDLLKLFDDLSQLILHIINRSRVNADAKAQANLYMGQLIGWFHEMYDIYEVGQEYDLRYDRDEMYDEMKFALKRLIKAYAYLKNGGSLKHAIDIIFDEHLSGEEAVEDTLEHLAKLDEDLRPRPYW